MKITQDKFPRFWEAARDDLSLTERKHGFEIDDSAYARFRAEADETMNNLPAYLCDVSGMEVRQATPEEVKKSKQNGGLIVVDGTQYAVSEPHKDVWAIYNALFHPGFRKDTQIPEISETKSSPHSTAGLPKVLDAAEHLITSIENACVMVSHAVRSEKSHKVDLDLNVSDLVRHEVRASFEIEHRIPALEALVEIMKPRATNYKKALMIVLWAIAILLLLLISGVRLHAQTTYVRGVNNGTTPATSVTVTPNCVANHNCLDVNIASGGGSGGTSSSFGAAFPATGTAVGFIDASGNMAGGTLDLSGYLKINCAVGCSGGATTPTDAFANPTTASLSMSFPVGYNGTTWDLLRSGDKNNVAGITGVLNTAGMGRYNATQPTLTDTRYNLFQLSSRGEILVAPGVSGFAVSQSGTWNIGTVTTLTSITNPVAVTQSGTWTVQPGNTANSTAWLVTGTGGTFPVTGTFWQSTQPVSLASAQVASGAYASGSISSGACAAGCIADGGSVTLGAKADAKSTATDTTAVSIMSVLKEISAMEQAPASRAVTNAGTFATQSAITAASGSIASGAISSGAIASGAVASGAFASGSIASGACASGCIADGGITTLGAKTDAKSTATDGTSTSVVSILKEISAMAQSPAALPSNQSTNVAQINAHTALEGGTNGSLAIGGTVATNVAITANPINLGAQAVSSENSAVTTARQVQLVADLVGKLIVLPYANPENFVNGTTAAITDTTSTSTIASAGGSLRNYITSACVTNSHATVGTFVKLLEGTNIIWEVYAAPAGGGACATFPVALRGAAATAINCQPVTTGANVICTASGYKGL